MEGDLKCTVPLMTKLVILSFAAGFFSASLGIGLALLVAPMLLSCGLDPLTTAATEIHSAFYSALTSTLIVILLG